MSLLFKIKNKNNQIQTKMKMRTIVLLICMFIVILLAPIASPETQPSEDEIYYLPGDNTWEYTVINGEWRTREKGTSDEWLTFEKLSPENREAAIEKLNTEHPDAITTTQTYTHPVIEQYNLQADDLYMMGEIVYKVQADGGSVKAEFKVGDVFVGEDGHLYEVQADGTPEDIGPAEVKEAKPSLTMEKFGLFLDEWTYITSGYRGLSFFYSEPSWWLGYDETVMNILGGIDGWTSLACQSKITDAHEYGVAMSSTTSGAFAHIEGEKIKVNDYSSEELETYFLYKISLEVDPGPKYRGCDMKFKVYVQKPRRSVFKNSKTGLAYTFRVEKGNESVSYKGQGMVFKESETNYEKVCIHFTELDGHCLAGIEEGEELCNKIIDSGEKEIDLGDDPCEEFPLMINCWFGEEETTPTWTRAREEGEVDWGDW